MPARRFTRQGFSRRSLSLRPVDSNKNVVDDTASTGTTRQDKVLVLAKDSATNTVQTEVERGCSIRSIYLSFDVCGLAGTGVLQRTNLYLMKNPGANLTPPSAFAVGTSNEKKFVFRQWQVMTMRNQDGNVPFHWEGWIKIPRHYQRFGADDQIHLSFMTDTAAGHLSLQCIYKWFK